MNLRNIIELHCGDNPFIEKTPLKSLVSSALVSVGAKNDILEFAEKGQKHFEEFVSEEMTLNHPEFVH